MIRPAAIVLVIGCLAAPLAAAQGTPDTVQRVLDLHALIERLGANVGPLIWPGFRPDTIPTLYVVARRGKVLVQWRHDWPAGFAAIDGRTDVGVAGSGTVALPSGKFIAFMSVDSSMSPGLVLGTSIHEAFHSYERSVMQQGRMFGGWENAMLVGTYPVFDVENEAAFALEGKTLRRALEAPTTDAARRFAREFLALREGRQRVLDSEFTEFEKMAEMNEGLAQYALIRGLREVARLEGGMWEAAARYEAAVESALLDSLLALSRRSVRRRFYATGSAIALLLDRLAEPTWKDRVVRDNLNLQETLALVTGYDGTGESGLPSRDQASAGIRAEAERAVTRLRTARTVQADSIIRASGLRLIVDPRPLGPGVLQWCGFDPQNTLQTGDGRTIHMRFLQVCAGGMAKGDFNRAAVQDDTTSMITLGVDSATLRMTTQGQPIVLADGESAEATGFVLDGTDVHVEAKRARVTRTGASLTVLLLKVEG
jgi:hypothetical protein